MSFVIQQAAWACARGGGRAVRERAGISVSMAAHGSRRDGSRQVGKTPSFSGRRYSVIFQGVWVQGQKYLQPFSQTNNHTLCTTQLVPPSQNTAGWGLDDRHLFSTVPEVRNQRLGPGESSLPGADGLLLAVSSCVSSDKGTNHSPGLITSQRPYLLTPSHWELVFQHVNSGQT